MNRVLCSTLIICSVLFYVSFAAAGSSSALDIYNIQQQKGKMVKNGELVTAHAVISNDKMKSSSLKDIAKIVVVELKKQYPSCQWFHFEISNDRRMIDVGNYLAVVSEKEGVLSINGGIPTESEIKEYKQAGINIIKPDNFGMNIFYNVYSVKSAASKNGRYISDVDAYKIVAKKMVISEKEVRKFHKGLGWYYMAKMNSPL